MKNDLDLFICTHDDFDPYPHDDTYKIVAGKNDLKKKYDIPVIIEENEKYTHLQKTINEFTRMWYVYKHVDLKDYVGFCHYRRFFSFYDDIPSVQDILKGHDIVVNNQIKTNMKSQYASCHNESDYNLMVRIVKDLYRISNKEMALYEKSVIPCNIFITNKDMFYRFCEFQSSVIDEFLKQMNFKTYEDVVNHVNKNKHIYTHVSQAYQSRLIAFLIERISTIFFKKYSKNLGFINIKYIKQYQIPY